MKTAVWWIRRDLRLRDNQALAAAINAAAQVLPLFIIDPFFENSAYVGEKRYAFLWAGLRQLDADLHLRGSQLIVRYGRPQQILSKIMAESSAEAIFAEEDFTGYARRRDAQIGESLPLTLTPGIVVHPPGTVLKQNDDPYIVFTPFKKKAWLARPLPQASDILPAPDRINSPKAIQSDDLPTKPELPAEMPFEPGETEAQRRLQTFAQATIDRYAAERNIVSVDGTSQLSPYLRFGMLSARQAVVTAVSCLQNAPTKEARKGADTWLSELIWREFYVHILHHFPHVLQRSFRAEYDHIVWRNEEDEFVAWCNGRTGYPLVDAAMRQLTSSGWMHNRARMVVASFLVKDLLIDWRWGEKFFMQHLVDGDPAANNGGWQWTAGTGTDAAPYFRIFNPTSQAIKFDPSGEYIRRWLPELADVPNDYIHEPWKMPPLVQKGANCQIGSDYPQPIVDHHEARDWTLAAYKHAREADLWQDA
ncbi:cryptochrome/photolyase family protein [Candidatus Leptofilum sp.]|uniref:cryptochrome/photolyase family protein n=1 Tax=Candidatus Leptofilum sp. TaxID=3241576 RepID=UPI003B5B5A23